MSRLWAPQRDSTFRESEQPLHLLCVPVRMIVKSPVRNSPKLNHRIACLGELTIAARALALCSAQNRDTSRLLRAQLLWDGEKFLSQQLWEESKLKSRSQWSVFWWWLGVTRSSQTRFFMLIWSSVLSNTLESHIGPAFSPGLLGGLFWL